MDRREFLGKVGAGTLGGWLAGQAHLAQGALEQAEARGEPRKAEGRPNVLIIMCDQLNARVLGCYGGDVPTANIDRLAREGVLFTDATCPWPVCSPTRASLITGLYPHTHGITYNVNRRDYPAIKPPASDEGIKASDITAEKLLYELGYQTHHYGKWHLMDEDLPYYRDMFGEHREYMQIMARTFDEVRKRPREQWMDWYDWALPVTVSPALQKAVRSLGDRWNGKRYSEFITKMGRLDLPLEQDFDVQVADRTIACLRRLGRAPFMVTCSFNHPHDPNVASSPYYEMFLPEKIRLPANYGKRESRFEKDWSRQIVADLGEPGLREFLRIYYGCVKKIDDLVGRILRALDETGRADNTIVLFTADHGDMAGGHGMVWKSTSAFYDEIVRVPLIIRYPAKVKPARMSIAACLTDVMPTLLNLVGCPIPAHVQGHSLAPYLRGQKDLDQAAAYTFSERLVANETHARKVAPDTPGSFMVRGRGWKHIRYRGNDEYLYDLVRDPGETKNLANDPAFQEWKKQLRRELENWLLTTGFPERRTP